MMDNITLYKIDEKLYSILQLLNLDENVHNCEYNKMILELYYEPQIIYTKWDYLKIDDLIPYIDSNKSFYLYRLSSMLNVNINNFIYVGINWGYTYDAYHLDKHQMLSGLDTLYLLKDIALLYLAF